MLITDDFSHTLLSSLYSKIMSRFNQAVAESPVDSVSAPPRLGILPLQESDEDGIHYAGFSTDDETAVSIGIQPPSANEDAPLKYTKSLAVSVSTECGDLFLMFLDTASTDNVEIIADQLFFNSLAEQENLAQFINIEKQIYSAIFSEPAEKDSIINQQPHPR